MSIIISGAELRKIKRIAAESVRRGISYDDWVEDAVPRLMDMGTNEPDAIEFCWTVWRDAVEEDQRS